jgi:hypothetical protein
VSFTASRQTVNAPSSLTTCDGCANDANNATAVGQKTSSGPTTGGGGNWGNNWQQTQGATSTVFGLLYSCNDASTGSCGTGAGTRVVDQSGSGNDCYTTDGVSAAAGSSNIVGCQVSHAGPVSVSQVSYNNDVAPCGTRCDATWGYYDTVSTGSNAQYAYFVPNPCSGDGGAQARSNIAGVLASEFSGGLGADAIGQQTAYTNGGYCANPSTCAAWGSGQNVGGISTHTWCATGSAWKLTYSPSGAQSVQTTRVQSSAPAGYSVLSNTISACPGGVSVSSTDVSNGRATLSCPTTATALYVWTQSGLASLQQAIAGKTVAQAQSIVAGTTGVGGNVSVSIAAGYTYLPQDPLAISMIPN